MTYKYESFGDTLNFAEKLGFREGSDCSALTGALADACDAIDALETEALDFIASKGYKITE